MSQNPVDALLSLQCQELEARKGSYAKRVTEGGLSPDAARATYDLAAKGVAITRAVQAVVQSVKRTADGRSLMISAAGIEALLDLIHTAE